VRVLVAKAGPAIAVGLLVGVLYWLLGVPTPAPPWVALCGLLGILLGEYITSTVLARFRSHRRAA
jgi:XapX domain-containing protein